MGLSDFLSFLAVGVFLAVIGEVVSRLVGPSRPGWRARYHQTVVAHPLLAGALIAFARSLPVPPGMGDGMVGRLVWFVSAGGLSAVIYRAVRVYIARKARSIGDGDAAPPPAGPPP